MISTFRPKASFLLSQGNGIKDDRRETMIPIQKPVTKEEPHVLLNRYRQPRKRWWW
jgi:hypothetical protein